MLNLKYVGESNLHVVNYNKVNDHVIQITGDFPIKGNGFTLSRIGVDDNWDYKDYNTIYQMIENGCQFSNDGSIYVAPPEPEPIPEPEPYVPTLEEIKEQKKSEIRNMYQNAKAIGTDVVLSTGTEHFPLTDEDITFLMGKQIELSAGESEMIAYQDANQRCKMYSREDMQTIITSALLYVNYQTTYRNNLCEWVDDCESEDEINNIYYGMEIPEEHQNDVFKSYHLPVEDNSDESTN